MSNDELRSKQGRRVLYQKRVKNESILNKIEQHLWGVVLVLYVALLLFIMFIGIYGVLITQQTSNKYYISKTLFEKSSDGIITGFVLLVITNAVSNMQKNKKK